MEGDSDDDVADEEGDGQEGVDVVVLEVVSEEVESSQHCVPPEEGVDAVEGEYGNSFCRLFLHLIHIRPNNKHPLTSN